jgi:hypothetical protein
MQHKGQNNNIIKYDILKAAKVQPFLLRASPGLSKGEGPIILRMIIWEVQI